LKIDGAPATIPTHGDSSGLRKAAADFEALVIAELLKNVKFGSPDGEQRDQAASTMLDFGHEQIAGAIASAGGIGLAALAVRGLEKAEQPKRETAVR
jgi:Rod binding domain-containing protein